jgi:hypothetical protein
MPPTPANFFKNENTLGYRHGHKPALTRPIGPQKTHGIRRGRYVVTA